MKIDSINFEDGHLHDLSFKFNPKSERSCHIIDGVTQDPGEEEAFWVQTQSQDFQTGVVTRSGCYLSYEEAQELAIWIVQKLAIP